jgi:hypothetical protein
MSVKVGDIVQARRGHDWFPCLVIVTEVRSWGIRGYTSVPREGDAYIRLENGDFEDTGGEAVWRNPFNAD